MISKETTHKTELTEEWFLNNGFIQDGEDEKDFSPYFYKGHADVRFLFRFAKFRNDWGFYIEYTDSPFDKDEGVKYPVSFGLTTVQQLEQLWELITIK